MVRFFRILYTVSLALAAIFLFALGIALRDPGHHSRNHREH